MSGKARKTTSVSTPKFSNEEILRGWSPKHPKCKTCGKKELKRYSGSSCSKCYTEARNARLGIGKDSPEAAAKRLKTLETKVTETEMLLAALKAELKKLKA
jgi:tRNA(Ile2) C34 agmatinyltransferase TiaS